MDFNNVPNSLLVLYKIGKLTYRQEFSGVVWIGSENVTLHTRFYCPYHKNLKSLFKCIASGDSGIIFLTEISSASLICVQ